MSAGLRLEIRIDDKGSASVEKVEGAYNALEKRVRGGSARMSAAVNRVRQRFAGLGQAISRGAMIAKIALAGLAVAAIVTGAKFEQSMANVAAVSGATNQELQTLTATARGLGATTAFSASQAAEAMYSLASAGQSVNQIVKTSASVLLFAGAAATDLGSAAEILVQTLAMFNLEASESSRVVNVFAAAISGTLLNAERLREGLSQVGATSSALGMSLEETVATLGLLNSAGSIGGIAGTRLKNVLVRLAAPNQVLSQLLGEVSLKTDGLAASMEALKDADPGKIFKAFGRIAAPAVLVLRKQTEEMGRLKGEITGTQKAQEMFNTQMNTLGSQFKIFKSQLQENMIAVFMALRDSGFDVIQGLTRGLQKLKPVIVGVVATVISWIKENKDFLTTLAKVGGAILGVVIAVNLLVNPMTWIIGAVVILTKLWSKWGDAIKENTSAAVSRVVDFAWSFLESNREAVEGTIGLFRGLANFLIGVIVWAGKNWADFGRYFWEVMQEPIAWVWDKLKWLAGGIAKVFAWLGGEIADSMEEMTLEIDSGVDEQAGLFGRANAEIIENAKEAFGVDYVGAIGSGLGKGLEVAKEKLGQIKDATKTMADEIVKTGERVGGAVEAPGSPGGDSTGTDEAAAQATRDANTRAQAEIAAALKVENERRASLVRTIGFDALRSEEWLEAKLELIRSNYNEQETMHGDNAEKMAELEVAKAEEVAQAKMTHQQAVAEHFMATHQAELWAVQGLEVVYDTFFESLLDKHATARKRMEAIQRNLAQYLVKSFAHVAKEFIKSQLFGLAVARSAKDKDAAKDRVQGAKIGAIKAYSAFANIPIIGPILGAVAAAAAFAFLMAFNQGGIVPGVGTGRDSVHAILEPGEHITRASSVRAVGAENLEYINRTGRLPAGGGGGDINVSVSTGGGAEAEITAYLEDEVVPRLEDIQSRRRYKIGGGY